MPTLQFKGKSSVWNHHLAIPYHTLDELPDLRYLPDLTPQNGQQLGLETPPEPVTDHLLIEGDNLLALKALLPRFAGKVKCIYIDPPYNTGNEGWVYNDNVNNPLLREWLGREVGRDDLTRHDKWLCMMTPRLKLLRELLADDGVIFISIDDNEVGSLKLLADEIFAEENFAGVLVWKRRTSSALAEKNISTDHEYVICYQKSGFEEFAGDGKTYTGYSNPDGDPRGEWRADNLTVGMNKDMRPNQFYELVDPKSGKSYPANPNRVWAYIPESMDKLIAEGRVLFPEDTSRRPLLKRFKEELKNDRNPLSTWMQTVGLNTEATRTMQELFDENVFNYAKPLSLVKLLIRQATSGDDLILDSFAGSGTTGHAVMELNAQDGGRRRCILVQMTEETEREPDKNIARDITRERLRRAIDKHGFRAGFRYQRVGQPLDAETLLSGQLPAFDVFARYVYYLATGENLPEIARPDAASYFVGTAGNRAIYLVYQPDFDTLTTLALNLDLARQMQAAHSRKKLLVYAPACFLDDEHLEEWQIEFVSIPYNLFQRT
jgi:adenine-specific DNA-methyltransferase